MNWMFDNNWMIDSISSKMGLHQPFCFSDDIKRVAEEMSVAGHLNIPYPLPEATKDQAEFSANLVMDALEKSFKDVKRYGDIIEATGEYLFIRATIKKKWVEWFVHKPMEDEPIQDKFRGEKAFGVFIHSDVYKGIRRLDSFAQVVAGLSGQWWSVGKRVDELF